MPYYDEIVKHLMDQFPYAFAALALNTADVEIGERLNTEQPSEEIMQESPFYERVIQRGIEQGIERGARQTTIENTLAILTARFPHADVDALRLTLEAIADLDRLKQLNLTASLAPSFEAFQHGLET